MNIQLLIERGWNFSTGSTLDTHHTVNHCGHDAIMSILINISRWVTKREPSTTMSTSNEYINLGFIKQTISEEWNDGVTLRNLRSNLELFAG